MKLKVPKGWNKLSIDGQREWVAGEIKRNENYLDELKVLSRRLVKHNLPVTMKMSSDDRPDLVQMK